MLMIAPPAITVPIAAPSVPKAGIGPKPPDQNHVQANVQHRVIDDTEPHAASARRRRTGALRREHEEEQHAEGEDEHRPQVRQGFRLHLDGRIHQLEQHRGQNPSDGGEHERHHHHGGEEGLIHRPVDLVGFVGAGEPGHEDTHAGEERRDEDDDDEEDLPGHPDRGVAHVTDVVPDHGVVDQALQPADDVLEHRRPRQLPDGSTDRSLDDRSIERPGPPSTVPLLSRLGAPLAHLAHPLLLTRVRPSVVRPSTR